MRRFGLIGHPLSHSFSSGYFETKFKALGIDAEYVNLDFPTVEDCIEAIRNSPDLEGVNVTIPYKQAIIPFLDDLDCEASAIRAVNTIKVIRTENGVLLKGYNTDVIGFRDSLSPLLTVHHQRALVLGSGGAAKAAVHVLIGLGMQVTTVARHMGMADLTYQELDHHNMATHTLIVNSTPVGMFPNVNECPDIPYAAIASDHLLYDMVYNPMETEFMLRGLLRGATVCGGLAMLHGQAEASWAIWNSAEA